MSDKLSRADYARFEQLAATFDADVNLICSGDRRWVAQFSLEYAILLLRSGSDSDRAQAIAIIEAVLATQLHAPAWDRGRFPMSLPETWRDLNATLFMAPHLVKIYTHWLPQLPPDLSMRFQKAILEAIEAVDRRWADEVFDVHRDFTAYSNIFVLYIQALLLFGRCLDDERLQRDGEAQWQRWFNHVSTYGIDEFCSPTYNEVVYEGLLGILGAATSTQMQREARLVLDYLFVLQHAVSHPLLHMGVVGTARDYRQFVQPGAGGFRFIASPGDATYSPPAAILEEFRHREFPYHAEGRAGLVPFRFQTWQLPDAAMGSMTGGHYFPQQIHLMIAAGTSPVARACAFFQADERNPINGYVCQHENRALCLFARTPTSYRLNQLRESARELPLPGTLPPCLGLTEDWTVRRHEPGRLTVAAQGYSLDLQTFTMDGERMEPVALISEPLEINGRQVIGWRAAADVVWFACLVELFPDGGQPAEATVSGQVGDRFVELRESGGLTIRLARRPSGELVELYDKDWRTLPLFDSRVCSIEAGDMAVTAVEPTANSLVR